MSISNSNSFCFSTVLNPLPEANIKEVVQGVDVVEDLSVIPQIHQGEGAIFVCVLWYCYIKSLCSSFLRLDSFVLYNNGLSSKISRSFLFFVNIVSIDVGRHRSCRKPGASA